MTIAAFLIGIALGAALAMAYEDRHFRTGFFLVLVIPGLCGYGAYAVMSWLLSR